MPPPKKLFFHSLHGLRAISIMMVLLHHLVLTTPDSLSFIPDFLLTISTDGQLGVNVFFVISGFLITSLLMDEEQRNGEIALKAFFIRRGLRIFPVYYTMIAVYGILQFMGYLEISFGSYFTALTYTKYFNWTLDSYTAHAWSLSIEEQFYLVWPICFFFSKKYRTLIVCSIIGLVCGFRVLDYYYSVSWINGLSVFVRADAIAIGCLFALKREFLTARLKMVSVPIVRMGALLVVCLLSCFADVLETIQEPVFQMVFIPFGTNCGTIANICIGLIVLSSVEIDHGIGFKVLNSRVLVSIGTLSYSLYIWQQFFFFGGETWIHQFPQNLILILAVSTLSYFLLEKPFLKFKKRFQK